MFYAESSASKWYIIVHIADQCFAATAPSQASKCAIKPIAGRKDAFQWNKTDTYDVLVINPSNAFSHSEEPCAKLYTGHRTELY